MIYLALLLYCHEPQINLSPQQMPASAPTGMFHDWQALENVVRPSIWDQWDRTRQMKTVIQGEVVPPLSSYPAYVPRAPRRGPLTRVIRPGQAWGRDGARP